MPLKEQNRLNQELEEVIRQMRKIQKSISDDGQPASILDLDQLTGLGKRYAEIVSRMKTDSGE